VRATAAKAARITARPACDETPDMVLLRSPIIFSQHFNTLRVAQIVIAWT
jgi:hypothetical protein